MALRSELPALLRREPAAGLLEGDLERLELVHDVAPGAVAQRFELRAEGEVHDPIVTRPLRASARRRGRWDVERAAGVSGRACSSAAG